MHVIVSLSDGTRTLNPVMQFAASLASKVVKAHDFMPELKVGRFMPVVIVHTTLLLHQRGTKLFNKTEANVHTIYLL